MRLVVADDSALIRDGLRRLLPAHGFEIVAAAANVPACSSRSSRPSPTSSCSTSACRPPIPTKGSRPPRRSVTSIPM